MLVKIEARILIFPSTDFYFPSTSVPPCTFLGSAPVPSYFKSLSHIFHKSVIFVYVWNDMPADSRPRLLLILHLLVILRKPLSVLILEIFFLKHFVYLMYYFCKLFYIVLHMSVHWDSRQVRVLSALSSCCCL